MGALVSASAAAIYTTSSRMVRLGSIVLLAIVQAVGPQISEFLSRHQRSRAEHVYRISTWWLMTLTWPLYITMAIFAPLLLRIFGADFSTGAEVVATMCAAMLLSTAMGPVDMVLLMGGKSGWNLINGVLSLATNVILNLLLVPHLGIEGAAIAFAASVALNILLPYVEVRALLHISPFAAQGPSLLWGPWSVSEPWGAWLVWPSDPRSPGSCSVSRSELACTRSCCVVSVPRSSSARSHRAFACGPPARPGSRCRSGISDDRHRDALGSLVFEAIEAGPRDSPRS